MITDADTGGDAGRRPHPPEPLRGGRRNPRSKQRSPIFPLFLRNVSIKSGKSVQHVRIRPCSKDIVLIESLPSSVLS